MKNLVYCLIVLISFLASTLSQAQYTVRKVSPAISAPGGNVTITLKTPTNFNFTTGASMDVIFKSRETNAVQFAIVGRGLPSWGLSSFGGSFSYQHPEFINSSFNGGIDTLQKYTFALPPGAPLGLYDIVINNVYSPQIGNPQPITRTPIYTLTGGIFIEGGAVSGKIFYDLDGNGIKNGSDKYLANQEVLILGSTSTISGATDQNGVYKFNLAIGTYTVKPALKPNWQVTSTANSFSLSVSTSSSFLNKDFALSYNGSMSTIVSSFATLSRLRCNSDVIGQIDYQNAGALVSSGKIKFLKDPITSLTGFYSPNFDTMNGDTLIWNLGNLIPEERGKIQFGIHIPGANFIGRNAIFFVRGETLNSSISYLHSDQIRCSFDPNDKKLYAAAKVNPDTLSFSTTFMEYQVDFQNTGNDTAYTVIVKDTLDTNLDFNSLKFISSSHNVAITKFPNSRSLQFRFNNINLPYAKQDSIKSQGFIKFSVQRNSSLPEGTKVFGKASIYFDLNPAIITNTLRTTFVSVVSDLVNDNGLIGSYNKSLHIFPNPTSSNLSFSIDDDQIMEVQVFDLLGNRVANITAAGTDFGSVSLEGVPLGSYIYQVTSSTGKLYKGLVLKK